MPKNIQMFVSLSCFCNFSWCLLMSIKSICSSLVAGTSELFISSNTKESFLEQVAEIKLQHVHDLM